MKRRDFITSLSLSSFAFTPLLKAKESSFFSEEFYTINTVLNTLFPKTSTMPSAKEFNAINYLIQNIDHPTFNKEHKDYLLNGAKVFKEEFIEFFSSSEDKREKIIEEVLQSSYGSGWIELLVYYGLEALLSDPIYGGNKDMIGWKSLNHQYGKPRAKVRYVNGKG